MLGATSIGAPPVILYLLSSPDLVAVTRANLTLYVVVLSAAGLVMLGFTGLLDSPTIRAAAELTIPFVGAVWADDCSRVSRINAFDSSPWCSCC